MTAPTIDPQSGDEDQAVLPSGWRGLILPTNTVSGDRRTVILDSDIVPARPLPLPLSAQYASDDDHKGSVVIGLITRLWVDEGGVWGEGAFDLEDPVAMDWAGRVGRGVAGWVSADLSDITGQEVPVDSAGQPVPQSAIDAYNKAMIDGNSDVTPPDVAGWLLEITAWKMMGATLVASPAFESARVQPVYDFTAPDTTDTTDAPVQTGAMIALVPAAEDADRLAVGGSDTPASELHTTLAYLGDAADWTPQARDDVTAAMRDLGWTGSIVGNVWGHASFNPDGNQCAVYLVNGDGLPELHASALELAGGCASPQIPQQHSPFVPHITAGYSLDPAQLAYTGPVRFDRLRVAFGGTDVRDIPLDSVTAALTAAGVTYDAADFSWPEADELTALTVTDDGRVYGHLAGKDTCHIGFSECVTPPVSGCNYAYYHQGEVQTTDGPLPVGKITLGTGHAGLNASARAAAAHYDNTGTAVAVVRARDGLLGPWLSGRILPGVGQDRVDELRRSGVSGDWRSVTAAADLELVAVLAVNVPGFPVPRQPVRVLSAAGTRTLLAAGLPATTTPPAIPAPVQRRTMTRPESTALSYFDSREFQSGVLKALQAARNREARVVAASARIREHRAQAITARMRAARLSIARRRVRPTRTALDANPADDTQARALQRYWTEDPAGLKRWAQDPHPYTKLVHELTEEAGDKMTPEEIKGLAAEYYHKVFGHWPGKHGGNKRTPAERAAALRAVRLAVALRKVRTPAGEKRYKLPIGSTIPGKGDAAPGKKPDFRGKSLDGLLDAAEKASAAGDYDTVDKILGEVDRREKINARARDRRTAKRTAQDSAYENLISRGVDEETAVERAYGIPVEKQRRTQAISTLRGWGFQGRGLDELVRSWHHDEVEIAYRKAEDATRGHMVKPKYEGKIGYRQLWSVNDGTARKYASDELLAWWDHHGRVTPDLLKASILDPARFDKLMAARRDYLT